MFHIHLLDASTNRIRHRTVLPTTMKVLRYSAWFLVTVSSLLLSSCQALAPNKQPLHTNDVAVGNTQSRGVFLSTLMGAAASAALVSSHPESAMAKASDGSAFCGTFSDPINHPGGTRTIRLLESNSDDKLGDYQLAQVIGGGGIGEPKSYVLPAVVIGDRAIVIDFSPKGGPRDFTGVLDGKDIKFLRDGNKWPRLNNKD